MDTKNKFTNKWFDYTINIEQTPMVSLLMDYSVNKFKKLIHEKLEPNQFYHCQLKVNFKVVEKIDEYEVGDELVRSISYLQLLKKDGPKESLLNKIFWHFWRTVYEKRYHLYMVQSLIFSYKIIPQGNWVNDLDLINNIKPKEIEERINKHISTYFKNADPIAKIYNTQNLIGNEIPLTMDIEKWGYTIFNEDYTEAQCWIWEQNEIMLNIFTKTIVEYNSTIINVPQFLIKIFKTENQVSLVVGGNTIFTFFDTLNLEDSNGVSPNLNSFYRKLNNTEYYISDGKVLLIEKEKKVNFISSKNKDSYPGKNFITMDLETKVINEKMVPYCVSIFDGVEASSFYISDFKDSNEMLENAIRFLMVKNYDGYKIFLHNFSYFDGIFLLKIISGLANKISLLIRDNRLIDVKVNFGEKNKYKIYFRDSLLLLPSKLSKLARSFNVLNKGMFPYKFVNRKDINFDYIGDVPGYEYFVDKVDVEDEDEDEDRVKYIDYKDYAKEFNLNWSLEKETIKYCERDCIVLYQIIKKFSKNIYEAFKINVLNTPTLSSLAFSIYRSNFLSQNAGESINIPVIKGKMYSDIKNSYTGGAVDVYIPYGENLYLYDINSLYPSVMKDYPMPVGVPTYFTGDIQKSRNFEEKPFGFFEVEITTPDNIKHPILQTKINVDGGSRTIAGVGTWKGWYFSEELYNAEKYGYKFKILQGYLFKKSYIFRDYVDFLYKMKVESEKNSANYTISKLLLNSLYGRLGMSPYVENHILLTENDSSKFCMDENKIITNIIDLGNGNEIISYFKKEDVNSINDDSIRGDKTKNISIAVAAAVTSYARIVMSSIKMNPKLKIYYSDTDSVVLDTKLNSDFVSSNLGAFKLEETFEKAVFIAPKVYGGVYQKLNKKGELKKKTIIKIKGLKNPLEFEKLELLLNKGYKEEVSQEKWYRDISTGSITISNEVYSLMITENKRKLIYIDGKFKSTEPLKILNDKIIDPDYEI